MKKTLRELIYISRKVGKDRDLTQGNSGNTSIKTADGKFMFIKASGTALKDMSVKKGWCKLNLQKVRKIIKDKKFEKSRPKKREVEISKQLINVCTNEKSLPSIETNLHAFLDKYIIHLHPFAVCAFLTTKNGKAELEKLFAGENPPPLWVGFAKPGYALAKKIFKLTIKYRKKYRQMPKILFLERHGLFVCAKSAKEAIEIAEKVKNICEEKIKKTPALGRLNRKKIITMCSFAEN